MRRIRRIASVAAVTTALAVAGLAVMPAAQAGIEETAAPPAAYTIVFPPTGVPCQLATVNLATGEVVPLASTGLVNCVSDLAVAPDGSVWALGRESAALSATLMQFDPATGEPLSNVTITGSFENSSGTGLAFDGAGTLYAQIRTDEPGCDSADCLYTVDRETGAATLVGPPGDDFTRIPLFTLGADCAGAMATSQPAFDAAASDPSVQVSFGRLDSVDKATGLVTAGPDFPDNFFFNGLDYSRVDGTLYAIGTFEETLSDGTEVAESGDDVGAAATNASIFVVDPATGALTEVVAVSDPELNVAFLGIAGACPTTPEPVVLAPTFTG